MESGGALPIERAIVSVHLEEAQKVLERERELDLHFRRQWTRIEDYPACPAGLTLLRRFAEEHPQLYDDFVARNISGHHSLPALARNPRWIEYRHHWGTCEDCMEV